MNYFRRIGSIAFLVLISFWTTAQIQVSFPISRAVFQRSNANQATLRVSNQGLSLYPNPNPDKTVSLETQENLLNATVTIFTVYGQQVFTTSVPLFDERKQLILKELSSGSYVIRVQAAGFDVTKRILIGL